MEMRNRSFVYPFVCALVCMVVCIVPRSEAIQASDGVLKSMTFRYPAFTLGPGEVQNKIYLGIPFPKGHIALKGFDAEVVDEDGNSVPLTTVYLHHWVIVNYRSNGTVGSSFLGNDGVCPHHLLNQIYGLGSETRHTNTSLPDPYGIEVGNYDDEEWFLNLHAIDTRGTVNPLGCLECRCDLYNVTVDEYSRPIRDDYIGGLLCCYDGTQCQLKDSYAGGNATYYLQYTVHYMDWDNAILPVKVYILDVTFQGTNCKIEYNVPACTSGGGNDDSDECLHTLQTSMEIPVGGDVIYAVAHQHAGGIGAAIHGQDGREICKSMPVYGTGSEAGNEAGYIVGMTSCYPDAGSEQVLSGETLQLHSYYNSSQIHTGVMGLGYIVVSPNPQTAAQI